MTLDVIKNDITRLISLYEGERRRSEALQARLSQSQEAVESCKMQIAELNRQIDNLKLTGAFMAGGSRVEAKERVAALIREIDKCIALLED